MFKNTPLKLKLPEYLSLLCGHCAQIHSSFLLKRRQVCLSLMWACVPQSWWQQYNQQKSNFRQMAEAKYVSTSYRAATLIGIKPCHYPIPLSNHIPYCYQRFFPIFLQFKSFQNFGSNNNNKDKTIVDNCVSYLWLFPFVFSNINYSTFQTAGGASLTTGHFITAFAAHFQDE